jgi:uncharacterized coiled-coil protein SlyX
MHASKSAIGPVTMLAAVAIAIAPAYSQTVSARAGHVAPAKRAALVRKPSIEALQRQVAEQSELLESLRKAVGEQDARYRALQQQLEKAVAQQQQAAQPRPADEPAARPPASAQASQGGHVVRVGSAPPTPEPARNIAPIFDQPGVLTPRGQLILEPSIQYGYSSANRAALVGYTVVPALLIGLIDVREVRRNTWTGAIAARYGITNRIEVEARVPYVYRSDTTVSREIFTGTATDNAFGASGRGLGDIDLTGRYQLTDGNANTPYLIGSLRLKTRTGRDPFEVVTDCVTRCVSNTTGTGEPLTLPTGTGFYMLQPGLTWLYPTDPAVFFGSFTYGYNFSRSGLNRRVLAGQLEPLGTIKPGDVLGMNAGMGLALNDRSSFSIGIDLSSIGRIRQNGSPVPGSVRTQLASLMLGYSYRYNDQRTMNVTMGAGLTRDTPDVTINVRLPFSM